MTERWDQNLTAGDKALIDEIKGALQPPALSAGERARFDAALFARSSPRRTGWIGTMAWIPAVAAIALLVVAPTVGREPVDWLTPLEEAHGVMERDELSWGSETREALRDPLIAPDPDADLQRLLFDEYTALAYWLDTTGRSPDPDETKQHTQQ